MKNIRLKEGSCSFCSINQQFQNQLDLFEQKWTYVGIRGYTIPYRLRHLNVVLHTWFPERVLLSINRATLTKVD